MFSKRLVGAIGLEPTTPTMSIVHLAMRSFRINILRYPVPRRNDLRRRNMARLDPAAGRCAPRRVWRVFSWSSGRAGCGEDIHQRTWLQFKPCCVSSP